MGVSGYFNSVDQVKVLLTGLAAQRPRLQHTARQVSMIFIVYFSPVEIFV